MTPTITNEFRIQVFGLYPSAKVTDGKTIYKITSLLFRHRIIMGSFKGNETRSLSPEFHKLILKPLSSISDEDAIECARLLMLAFPDENPKTEAVGALEFIKEIANNETAPIVLPIIAADYLRSKNYALPYMGVDLIEAGIAITHQ